MMGHISQLPAKVLIKILSLLPNFDKRRATRVCKTWRRVITKKFGLVRELMWPTDHENNSLRDEALSTHYRDYRYLLGYNNSCENTTTSTINGKIIPDERCTLATSYSRTYHSPYYVPNHYHHSQANKHHQQGASVPVRKISSQDSSSFYSHLRRDKEATYTSSFTNQRQFSNSPTSSNKSINSGREPGGAYSPVYSVTSSSSSSVALSPVNVNSYQGHQERIKEEEQKLMQLQKLQQAQNKAYLSQKILPKEPTYDDEEEAQDNDNGKDNEEDEETTPNFTLPRRYNYVQKPRRNPKLEPDKEGANSSAVANKQHINNQQKQQYEKNTVVNYLRTPAAAPVPNSNGRNTTFNRGSAESVVEVPEPESPASPIPILSPREVRQDGGIVEEEPVKQGFQYKNQKPYFASNDPQPYRMKPPPIPLTQKQRQQIIEQQQLMQQQQLLQQQLELKKQQQQENEYYYKAPPGIEKYPPGVNNILNNMNYPKAPPNSTFEQYGRPKTSTTEYQLDQRKGSSHHGQIYNNAFGPTGYNDSNFARQPSYHNNSNYEEKSYKLDRKERQEAFHSGPSNQMIHADERNKSSISKLSSRQQLEQHQREKLMANHQVMSVSDYHRYASSESHRRRSHHEDDGVSSDYYRRSSYLRNSINEDRYKQYYPQHHRHQQYSPNNHSSKPTSSQPPSHSDPQQPHVHHHHGHEHHSNTKGRRTGLVAHHLHYHPLPPGFNQADIDKFLSQSRETDTLQKKQATHHKPTYHHMKGRKEDVKKFGSSRNKIVVTKRKRSRK